MKLEEIKKWLEENKDSEDVKAYLSGLKGPAEVKQEDIDKYLVTEEGKKFLRSQADAMINQGIETFKEKTMPGLIKEAVDAKVKEINPDETPEQKQIREANDRIERLEKEKTTEKLEKLALQTLTNAKLSGFSNLMSLLVGADEAETIGNIEKLEKAVKAIVEDKVKEALPGRTPRESIQDKDPNFKNPWLKENFNLTEQGKIYREDPELARKLQEQASA